MDCSALPSETRFARGPFAARLFPSTRSSFRESIGHGACPPAGPLPRPLSTRGQYEEARDLLQTALREDPTSAPALLVSLGLVCTRLDQAALAFRYFRQAIQIDPLSSEAHFSLALLWLQHGNYQQGFIEYEWRLNRDRCVVPRYARARIMGRARA